MNFFDFLKDLNDTAKERLKTPITGAFFFSFIIWNWRPILLLLFSEQSIEDRIQIIDQYFCTPSALLWPIGIAFVYTMGVPMLMVNIDKLLLKTKKARVDNIYESKGHTMDKKIDLAEKEFKLKNVETGNKQIEDFQRQIKDLNESKSLAVAAYNNQIDELKEINKNLNSSKFEANLKIERLEDQKVRLGQVIENANKLGNDFVRVLVKMDSEDINQLLSISNIDNLLIDKKLSNVTLKKFVELGLVSQEDDFFQISDLGSFLINRIENLKK